MKGHNTVYGEQDNIIFNFHNIMESLKHEMIGRKGMMVKCPVCLDKVGIVLDANLELQKRKCRRCHNEAIFRKLAMGSWKIKSEMGITVLRA